MKKQTFRNNYYHLKNKFIPAILFIMCMNMYSQKNKFGHVAIGGGGYVTSIVASPFEENVFYAKTDVGGISRWNEATKEWTLLFGWVGNDQTSLLGSEAIAIDKSSSNKLYVLAGTKYWSAFGETGGTGILRSSDYGNSYNMVNVSSQFKANGNGSDRQRGESLIVDPANSNLLYCGTRYNNGLFKSTNAGLTWSKVTTFPDSIGLSASISFIALDENSAIEGGCQTIYVGVLKQANNMFVSKDGGKTWKSIGGNKGGKPNRYAISSDNNMYVTYGGAAGGIWKYNMTTEVWKNISPSYPLNQAFSGIDVDPNSPNKVVCSTYSFWNNEQPWGWGDCIFYSENGGTTWVEKAHKSVAIMDANGIPWVVGGKMHWVGCLTMSPFKPGWVWAVSGNGVFATENIAAARPIWKFMSKGLEETVPVGWGMMSVPGGPLISAVGDQGGYVHTDITKYPTGTISQSDAFAFAGIKTKSIVRTADQTDLLYSYLDKTTNKTVNVTKSVSHIALSENNGTSWTILRAAPDTINNGIPAISSNGKTILWEGISSTLGTRIYRTENKGAAWTLCNNTSFNSAVVADPVDSAVFYGYNSSTGYVYKSTDGGQSFVSARQIGTGGNGRIRTAHGIKGSLWINFGSSLQYTNDECKTFTTVPLSACASFALGKAAPDSTYPTLFIWGKPKATDVYGMYRSENRGKTWTRANDDLHQWGSLANAGSIEADQNVYSRVYKSSAGVGIPYMELDLSNGLEDVLTEQTLEATFYPNPFKTTVKMKINGYKPKSVTVYNLQGVMIRKFNSSEIESGEIEFGQDFAAGVYLVQVADSRGSKGYKIVKQ